MLAAGQGTRMRSAVVKVLHPIAGRPLLGWPLAALAGVDVEDVVVVVGRDADRVQSMLPEGVVAAIQEDQLGTGHATEVGLASLPANCDTVMVVCGDTPLITTELLAEVIERHRVANAHVTLVSAILPDAGSYGRIVRRGDRTVERIVEARDATPDQLAVGEFNVGLYCFDRTALEAALAGVTSNNSQGERYLTDVVAAVSGPVVAVVADDPEVSFGVNSRVDLAQCEAIIQRRLRERLMLAGVTMPDPGAVYLDADVVVGTDSVLWPGTHLRGRTHIGVGCQIGPDVVLASTVVGDGTKIISANISDSSIGAGCEVGPFAYLRPGVRMDDGAKVGTFVEVKNANLGRGAKVPHLSYIGDADIGAGTNIGAGNITANYDGFRKHRTTIGIGVKTGSDCVFVAPVAVGDRAMTGAGSIIVADIPDGALGIARARQSVIEGFTDKAESKARAAANAAKG